MSGETPNQATSAGGTRSRSSRRMAFAEQELRLISALVLLLGLGLFLALPFVLSIGSVVFLPLTTAIILTIILSPLADKLAGWGVPNILASLVALLTFFAVLLLALALILQPAVALFDSVPAMAKTVAERFSQLQDEFAWLAMANEQLSALMGQSGAREVVLASPSVIQQLAFATPSLLLETLLTLLMTFFMIEARVRLRRHLLFDRASYGTSIKAARVMREIQDRVAAYILTVAWINGCVGIVVAFGAWMLGVEAPVMWGGLAALLNFLPYIGPLLMTALLTLFGIGTAETLVLGFIPAAAYLALHTIESNVLTPSILGARFTMNPVMILIALSYFSWIWGVFGALLSVPILLMLTAFFDHVGKPNLVGFIFGEPLFATNLMALGLDENATDHAA
ncbi:AI-2E family transporter [Pontixanthobacter aestiaquae]|uniref:AI-2E family transporter n=1 Tax=Pontixanthobacter aestiaquae TaxID=1509367 RepID=A0A844Z4A4_9SPHN|nr:AI-2E family transporter [Pontixanthobacter aestiaquae]MDN3646464.1 AI-2E family transporter [Pontixanthobacter aestiaquae]MXO82548.1 AI-2E family transporter [Pontixanthobacter aestiaquae]